MSLIEVLAGVSVLVGALLQSAIGFGFALVCAPLLFAAAGPQQAVGILNALALAVNTFSLVGEGRRPQPLTRLAVTVLIWSVPGMLAGVFVLRNVDDAILQIALTATVFLTLAVRAAVAKHEARPAPPWAAPVTGVSSGVLTTTLSTAGPPLVLLLLGRGLAPVRVRDTLVVVFIAQSVLGIGALVVTNTRGAIPDPLALGALILIAITGQFIGRPLFARLADRGGYERLLTAVLVLSAGLGLVTVLT